MAGNRIEFAQFGHFDSFDVIRSLTSMLSLQDHELPTPIATGLKTMYYVDANVVEGLTYYYRVRVWRGSESFVSGEVACIAGVLWTPDLSTAKIFLLSDDLIVGSVSAWKDRKTGVDFTQTSNSRKPLVVDAGENKAVRYDGIDDLLSTTNSAITSLMQGVSNAWIFAVYKQDGVYSDVNLNYRDIFRFSTSSTSSLFALFASTPAQNYKPAVGARRLASNTAQFCSATSGSSFDSVKMVLGASDYINQNFKIYVNTVNENTLTTSFGSGTTANEVATCTIGGYPGATNETFKGDIYAIVMGNTALSLAEQQKFEGWAAHKYGLTANLPVSHPYKNNPPFTHN